MKRLILGLLLLLPCAAFAQAPTCTTGATGGPVNAVISWTAPTLNTDGSTIAGAQLPLSYNIAMGQTSGSEAVIASGVSGSPQTITAGLQAGKTYYFTVTVKDAAGSLSSASNEACKTFPASVPGKVTITIAENGDVIMEFEPLIELSLTEDFTADA